MKNLNNFLKSNPDILSKYVTIGLTVVDKAVGPLNSLMRHLMDVQGIDPNTQPGTRTRKALELAVGNVEDNKDFDSDFNFSRFYSKFEKAKAGLDHLNLTKEEYRKATDLSKVNDKPEIRLFHKETEELPYLPGVKVERTTLNPLEDLAAFTGQAVKAPKAEFSATGNLDLKSLKKALQEIKKAAEELDTGSRPVIKDGTRVSSYSLLKKNKANKFDGGLFRRVNK